MEMPGLTEASADQRIRAEAAGLPVAGSTSCWTVSAPDATALAYAVVLPGFDETRVRAVAATDPASPTEAGAVVAVREALISALATGNL